MSLTVKKVHWKDKDYGEIDALKNRAFPKVEQVPRVAAASAGIKEKCKLPCLL